MIMFMRAWNHDVKQVTPEPNADGQAGGARGCGKKVFCGAGRDSSGEP